LSGKEVKRWKSGKIRGSFAGRRDVAEEEEEGEYDDDDEKEEAMGEKDEAMGVSV